MSLRSKIITIFLSITLVAIGFIVTVCFSNARDALLRRAEERLEVIADLKVDKIQTFFKNMEGNIRIAQKYLRLRTCFPALLQYSGDRTNPDYLKAIEELDDQFLPWLKERKEVADVMLVSPEGKIVYSANEMHAMQDIDNVLPDLGGITFEECKKRFYISRIFPGLQYGGYKFGLLATAPIVDAQKQLIGVLAVEINLDPIYKFIQDTTGLGETGETIVVRKEGDHVLFLNPLRHDPSASLKRKVYFGNNTALPAQLAAKGESGVGVVRDYRHKEVIAAWRYIPTMGWGLVAKMDLREVLAPVITLRNLLVMICFIVSILVMMVSVVVAQSIAGPIHALHRGAEIIGAGNLEYKVGTTARDEIGQLSRAFDRMTENLQIVTASRDELDKAKEAADSANRAKSDFLSNISHELRTPLNSVIGFSEILQDRLYGELNAKQEEYLDKINVSGKHLLSLIDDLLDVAKIESGKMDIETKRAVAADLIRSSVEMMKGLFDRHRIRLILHLAEDLAIEADEKKFKQIMYNLLSNAVKYTPDGGAVAVRSRLVDNEIAEIKVTDTGIGIKEEDIPKLFTAFTQLDASYTKKYKGTGLGLALTKKLVEMHGGTIRAGSGGEGHGSTFVITMPVAK